MQTRILAALLCGCAAASAALADTIVVNDQVQVRESQIDRPKRGSTMADVEKHFGAPVDAPSNRGRAADHALGLQRLRGVLRARPRHPRGRHRLNSLVPPLRSRGIAALATRPAASLQAAGGSLTVTLRACARIAPLRASAAPRERARCRPALLSRPHAARACGRSAVSSCRCDSLGLKQNNFPGDRCGGRRASQGPHRGPRACRRAAPQERGGAAGGRDPAARRSAAADLPPLRLARASPTRSSKTRSCATRCCPPRTCARTRWCCSPTCAASPASPSSSMPHGGRAAAQRVLLAPHRDHLPPRGHGVSHGRATA